ncbi:MAG TPA: asparagine synthetase B [archaeon]|nr:asparagine synthetase B [archaeon]
MCSVIGVYSKRSDAPMLAHKLICSLLHRGPEAFGIKTPNDQRKAKSTKALLPLPSSNLALAHCLLSTTGYGIQPLSSGDISISHNGQIYNYKDLNPSAKPLVSDSEVIARFFDEKLKIDFDSALLEFMQKAIGEYAVGILHGKKLYAFRDPVGFKPLWYGENGSCAAFASEPAALMKIDILFPRPLEPGHVLEISESGLQVKKIFTLEDFKKSAPQIQSINSLKNEFEKTIAMQCDGLESAAVIFSGGVDSSLVARAVSQKVKNTKLYVAGTKGSYDLKSAQIAAKELGLPLVKIVMSQKDIQKLALESVKILSFFDEMQIALAVPELACAKRIAQDGYKVVFCGQGSDEVFAGYSNYLSVLKEKGYTGVEEQIWVSLMRMWSRNLYRDDLVFAANSLELRVPLLSLNFLQKAMAIEPSQKILSANDGLRKAPIRELAVLFGVPSSIAMKPKKAMQYGSGSQKIVSKLFKGS